MTVSQNNLALLLSTAPARIAGCSLSFSLEMRNTGSQRLLLPHPEIIDLRLKTLEGSTIAGWYTDSLVHTHGCATVVLDPGKFVSFDLHARFRDAEVELAENDFRSFARWCIELPLGEYTAEYHYEVNDRFFDPDSGCTIKHLERNASEHDAVVWRGRAVSNAIAVVRPPDAIINLETT